jgi:hypothetical protein
VSVLYRLKDAANIMWKLEFVVGPSHTLVDFGSDARSCSAFVLHKKPGAHAFPGFRKHVKQVCQGYDFFLEHHVIAQDLQKTSRLHHPGRGLSPSFCTQLLGNYPSGHCQNVMLITGGSVLHQFVIDCGHNYDICIRPICFNKVSNPVLLNW